MHSSIDSILEKLRRRPDDDLVIERHSFFKNELARSSRPASARPIFLRSALRLASDMANENEEEETVNSLSSGDSLRHLAKSWLSICAKVDQD